MTGRERAIHAMTGGRPDQVPCVPLIDLSYAAAVAGMPVSECFMSPSRHAEALAAALERHPDADGLSINISLSDEVIVERGKTNDGYWARTVGGTTWNVPFNDVGSVMQCDIALFDDPRLEREDPFKEPVLQTLQLLPERLKQSYLINCGVTGAFSQVVFLMGLERTLMATVDDPDGLHCAIQRRLELAMQWIEELVQLDPGCVWIGEGPAASDLISPATYQKLVLPAERTMVQDVHQYGYPCLLHICGDVNPILELIPETGCDGLEFDWPVELRTAVQRTANRIALKGNLNTTLLARSDSASIERMALKLIESSKGCRGFILSSGCCIGRDTPPENVEAMIHAARNHHCIC